MPTDAERIRALIGVAERLVEVEERVQKSVDNLHDSVEEQNLHNARKIGWSIAAAAFAVVLSALMAVGYLKQVETSGRLTTLIEAQARTTDRLEKLIAQQDLIRNQVLCPMFRVFLGSYQPESRAPGPDRDKYEQAFAEMRSQYAVLQCTGDLVPPRGDLVTKPPK